MASESKTADTKPVAPAKSLSPASESGDPAVHQLLAERQTAVANDADVTEIDQKLADLGFSGK